MNNFSPEVSNFHNRSHEMAQDHTAVHLNTRIYDEILAVKPIQSKDGQQASAGPGRGSDSPPPAPGGNRDGDTPSAKGASDSALSVRPSLDLKEEARVIENLAKARLDSGSLDANHSSKGDVAAAKQLANEWGQLTQSEKNGVAAELTKQFDNMAMNTLPRPHILIDAHGQVQGIEFEASVWDFHSGPHKIQVNNK